jgi:very-short-patch-repair endonuclease
MRESWPASFNSGMLNYNRHLKKFARRLRDRMTDVEERLWFRVRRKQIGGVQFYRQKPIGAFIVDFYAPTAKLAIEVDGSQHFTADGRISDAIRDSYLHSLGLEVLRFDDRQVLLETDAVLEAVWRSVVGKS